MLASHLQTNEYQRQKILKVFREKKTYCMQKHEDNQNRLVRSYATRGRCNNVKIVKGKITCQLTIPYPVKMCFKKEQEILSQTKDVLKY